MKNALRIAGASTKRTTVVSFDPGAVERAQPGGPPTAFRIWHSGDNPTDHGPTVFSTRSAQALMAEQAARGNLYSIDVDHKSLSPDAPIDLRKAVGFHRLEVRGGELWAVDVEWTDTVRDGLTKEPPEWRYFSPAYDVDLETNEVISYLNTALTNNPATWNVTALASRAGLERESADAREQRSEAMKYENIMAELAALARGTGEDAVKAHKALKALMPDHPAEPDGDEGKGDGDDKKDPPAPPKKDEDAEDTKAASPDAEDTKASKDEEDTKKMAATKTVAELAAIVEQQGTELAEFRKEREDRQRRELLASKHIDPKVAAVLATKPLDVVRELVAAMPEKPKHDPAAADRVTATRGESQVDGGAPALPAAERAKLDERMGLKKVEGHVKLEGVHQVFATITPSQARRMASAASKGGK